ncbi:hypothetical protein [Actibacterium sp. D379-3]
MIALIFAGSIIGYVSAGLTLLLTGSALASFVVFLSAGLLATLALAVLRAMRGPQRPAYDRAPLPLPHSS